MRCYDVNFVDDPICKSDPSQKVLDSWIRLKTALVEGQKPPTNIARDKICRCEPVYPKIAADGLIKMGFPYCPRCGGKLSPVVAGKVWQG